jgi:hypothetical protein
VVLLLPLLSVQEDIVHSLALISKEMVLIS